MRTVYLVAYDISDDKRRTKLFNKLKGYGESLQFSLFRCILTMNQRLKMRAEVWNIINQGEDRVLLVDLGPEEGRGQTVVEEWGKALVDPAKSDGPLIL